jgi:F-type H+-transporting ATPase subunit delta
VGSATRSALAATVAVLDAQKSVSLTTAEQLLSVARAIDSSTQLRNLLADPAVERADKETILSRVFGSLDEAASAVLVSAVTHRWSRGQELVDGVEELGIRAAALTHGGDKAEKSADKIESELFAFSRAITSDPELELAISAKLGDPAGKVSLVDALIGSKASKPTLAIARHLVQSQRGRRVGQLFADAAEIVAAVGSRVVATVTTASALSSEQLGRLTQALTAKYGREPQLNVIVEPALIGGFRVQIADDVIDGSVASRLQDLRIRLAG